MSSSEQPPKKAHLHWPNTARPYTGQEADCELTRYDEPCPDGPVGDKPDTRVKERLPPPVQMPTEPGLAAHWLVDKFVCKAAPVELIQAVLENAQTRPPSNKEQFAADINRLLKAFELAVEAEDGGKYQLRVLPGASGNGYLQLRNSKQGRGFTSARIRVVREHL